MLRYHVIAHAIIRKSIRDSKKKKTNIIVVIILELNFVINYENLINAFIF